MKYFIYAGWDPVINNAKLKKNNEILLEDCEEFQTELEKYYDYFSKFGCKNFAEFQELIGLAKVSANDKDRDDWVRHQVCEEIRSWLKNTVTKSVIGKKFVFAKLDQIEQGGK